MVDGGASAVKEPGQFEASSGQIW